MPGPSGRIDRSAAPKLRLDKWLWQARFFKTRALAAKLIAAGSVRVNGARISRPGSDVTPGDVLIFPQDPRIRVIRILALGLRRGPAPQAQALCCDLKPGADPPGPLE